MLAVISPAKTLDFDSQFTEVPVSSADFLRDSQELIDIVKHYSADDIKQMMGVSDKIAELNVERFNAWNTPFTLDNAKQAVLAFKGDVYTGLDAETLTNKDFDFTQSHLRILSGLYGLLRPMDLMQAYRLEMGKKLPTQKGTNLYHFWGDKISIALNEQLEEINSKMLINLASNEYFKAVNKKVLNADIITPAFKDYKNGTYKMISFYAKKARGLLSRYMIDNQITDPEALKDFDVDGYQFNHEMTQGNTWVFTRKLEG